MQHNIDRSVSYVTPSPLMSFDLMKMQPGETIKIRTRNSSYWVTRTLDAKVRMSDMVSGFAVHSDSTTLKQWKRSPREHFLDRYVVLGSAFAVGNGHTSRVTSISHPDE